MTHVSREESPHGRHLGVTDVIMMIVQRIIGSGIFAVPSMIYKDVGGSPALFFLVWIIAGYSSYAGLMCYAELGSIIPRSGGLKAFLPVIYHKPYMMINVVYGTYILVFGSIVSNVIIFGEYFLSALGYSQGEFTKQHYKTVGIVFLGGLCLMLLIHTRFVVKLQTIMGIVKITLISSVSLIGIFVLALPSNEPKFTNNIHTSDFFTIKTQITIASFISAVMKAIFSCNGWQSIYNVLDEIKDPVRTMKIAAPSSIFLIQLCFFLINLTYLIIIPSDELLETDKLVGLVLFEKLFGNSLGRVILSSLIAFSVAGNITTGIYHSSRVNQEIFKEGFLPFSRTLVKNYPFKSSPGSLLLPLLITASFLFVPTTSSIFSYVINLDGYPSRFFFGLASYGILVLRRRKPDVVPGIKASNWEIGFIISLSTFMVLGPLLKPDNSQFPGLPNYTYVSLCLLGVCTLYWFFMFKIVPKLFHYELSEKHETLNDGMVITTWEKLKDTIPGTSYGSV